MISIAKELTVPPTGEPITLAEVKDHLRIVDDVTQDTMIQAIVTAAREYIEQLCGPLVTQTWRVYYPDWADDGFVLPGKVQSVASVKYTPAVGAQATVDPPVYRVDTVGMPGRVALDYGRSWPSAALAVVNPIEITATLGYGDPPAVPASIKHGMLLLVGHWYANPEGVITASKDVRVVDSRPLAMGIESLLANYRVV